MAPSSREVDSYVENDLRRLATPDQRDLIWPYDMESRSSVSFRFIWSANVL